MNGYTFKLHIILTRARIMVKYFNQKSYAHVFWVTETYFHLILVQTEHNLNAWGIDSVDKYPKENISEST